MGSWDPAGGKREGFHQMTPQKKSDKRKTCGLGDNVLHKHTHRVARHRVAVNVEAANLLVTGEVAGGVLAQDEGGLVKVPRSGPLGFLLAVESMVVKPLRPFTGEVHFQILFLLHEVQRAHRVFQSLIQQSSFCCS